MVVTVVGGGEVGSGAALRFLDLGLLDVEGGFRAGGGEADMLMVSCWLVGWLCG